MKRYERALTLSASIALLLAAAASFVRPAAAQEYAGPLTVEGLHQQENHSAAARGFGAVTVGRAADVGSMFVNPTAMQGLEGIHVTVGAARGYRDRRQEQHFAPVRYYPNLSLLLEGLTDRVPDPDPDLVGFTPADSVQRAFDDIRPNWTQSNTSNAPLHALVAAPVDFGGIRLVGGVGLVRYADLNYYQQNNNTLQPAVLEQRPLPTLRPTDDHPITVDWFQSIRTREGSIRGYGMALAGHVERYGLTVGVSGLVLDGESDDFEQRVNRGTLTFYANEFRADSSNGRISTVGKSDFSGRDMAVAASFQNRYVTLGIVARPPARYTRTYERESTAEGAGEPFGVPTRGEERFELPWRGSVGVLLKPRERLGIGIEYEHRPYASATFTGTDQIETSPWSSSSLVRVGAEYELARWITVRGGIRGEADVFIPDGSPVVSDPVGYRVYSAGLALRLAGVEWNITYENAEMQYADVWGSALSKNWDTRHTIIADISVTIPTIR